MGWKGWIHEWDNKIGEKKGMNKWWMKGWSNFGFWISFLGSLIFIWDPNKVTLANDAGKDECMYIVQADELITT